MNVHKNARLTPFGREPFMKQVLEHTMKPAATLDTRSGQPRSVRASLEKLSVVSGKLG